MSEMEFFHGYFEKSNLPINPEDTDDFYELKEEHQCHFVEVDGDLYSFWGSGIQVEHGIAIVLPESDLPQLMLHWYNGGAGVHEVAEVAIRDYLNDKAKKPK